MPNSFGQSGSSRVQEYTNVMVMMMLIVDDEGVVDDADVDADAHADAAAIVAECCRWWCD